MGGCVDPQVYAEPYVKRHYAGRCSAAWCLPFFGVVVAVIISFVLALSTGELWIKEHTFSAQPDVKFTYEVLLVLEVRHAHPGRPCPAALLAPSLVVAGWC